MYWRGNDAAGDLFGKFEAFAARARLDVEHHVAELAVAARLLLVPAAHLRPGADRLLVGHQPRLPLDRDAVLALQPFRRYAQVHLALAEQQHLVRVGVHLDAQRRIVLDQLGERRRELHLVLAVLEAKPGGEHRRRRWRSLDLHGAALLGADGLARLDAYRDDPAQRCRRPWPVDALHRLLAAQARTRRRRAHRARQRRSPRCRRRIRRSARVRARACRRAPCAATSSRRRPTWRSPASSAAP